MHLPSGAVDFAASTEALDLYRAYWHREPLPSHVDAITLGMARLESLHWACPLFGQTVARQNAKTDAIENRELFELLRGGAIAHTAQQHQIAKDSYTRLLEVIEGSDDLRPMVKRAPSSNQEVLIEFRNGGVNKYVARSSNKGLRGLADQSLLVFDEAQHLTAEQRDAAASIVKVNPNPQQWLGGSAHIKGLPPMWWGYRIMALQGESETLGWLEHSAETLRFNDDGQVEQEQPEPDDLGDRKLWMIANPGYEVTISDRNLQVDFDSAQGDKSGFARESLNVWDPPDVGGAGKAKIDPHWWRGCADPGGTILGQVVVGIDTTYDLDRSALDVCGRQSDGRRRVGVVQHDDGSHWVEIALIDVLEAQQVMAVSFDASGPAKSLRPMIERVVAEHNAKHGDDVKIVPLPLGRYQAACAQLVADAKAAAVAHASDTRLTNLAVSVPARKMGDGWLWDRRVGDISPLAAGTCAAAVADSLPEVAQLGDPMAQISF